MNPEYHTQLPEESMKQSIEMILSPTLAAGSVESKKSSTREGHWRSKEAVRKMRWRWLVIILK